MTIGIYRIFHVESGKSYIGQSKDVEARLCNHFWHLQKETHRNCHLQRAYSLYGADAFKSEILQVCTQELLTQQEQFWMDFYRLEGLYNSAPAAGTMAGYRHTEETRTKMSEAMKGNQNHKDKKGHKHSDETRQRLSEVNKGKKYSDETRQRIGEAHKGKKYSDETRQRISNNHVGMKGRTHSEETRRRMSESAKASRARQKAEKEAKQ